MISLPMRYMTSLNLNGKKNSLAFAGIGFEDGEQKENIRVQFTIIRI